MVASRVLWRYLFAKRDLAQGFKAALADLKEGRVESALKVLEDFWTFLDIKESGGHLLFNAEWFYAIGPRNQSRVQDIMKKALELRRSLPQYKSQGPVEPYYVKSFEDLIVDAHWLGKQVQQEGSEFQHGDFTIIPMPGITQKQMTQCLEALDKAADTLRKKFPQVLYGKVYLVKAVPGGVASYIGEQDTVQLSINAAKTVGDVYALCHEFGHRYETKFWKDKNEREAFRVLSVEPVFQTLVFDRVTRSKIADEFMEHAAAQAEGRKLPPQSELLKSYLPIMIRDHGSKLRALTQAFVKDRSDANTKALHEGFSLPAVADLVEPTRKVLREPIAVTEYGKKNWRENFAEAFAHLVLGMKLVPEIATIMDKLS